MSNRRQIEFQPQGLQHVSSQLHRKQMEKRRSTLDGFIMTQRSSLEVALRYGLGWMGWCRGARFQEVVERSSIMASVALRTECLQSAAAKRACS